MAYCTLKKIEEKKCLLISAGFEPLTFKNLFPEWFDDWKNDIKDIDDTDVCYLYKIFSLISVTSISLACSDCRQY